jgi:hypothetical protein
VHLVRLFVDVDRWTVGADGMEEREIVALDELDGVSAVSYPASPTTSISLSEAAAAAKRSTGLGQRIGHALRLDEERQWFYRQSREKRMVERRSFSRSWRVGAR